MTKEKLEKGKIMLEDIDRQERNIQQVRTAVEAGAHVSQIVFWHPCEPTSDNQAGRIYFRVFEPQFLPEVDLGPILAKMEAELAERKAAFEAL